MFCGSKDQNGVNWCSDCTKAEPLYNNLVVPYSEKNGVKLIYHEVGGKEE